MPSSTEADREIDSLSTKLRKRFEDIKKTGRKPSEFESALIKVQIDNIKALRAKTTITHPTTVGPSSTETVQAAPPRS